MLGPRRRQSARRRAAWVLVGAGGLLVPVAGAPTAYAATATSTSGSGTIVYTAAAGETNDVTITFASPAVTIVDTGAEITPIGDCASGGDANTVVCTAGSLIEVTLGDGDDQLHIVNTPINTEVSGGAGDDTITTSDACDFVQGGTGNDTISTGDSGRPDSLEACELLDGGPGADTLTAGPGRQVFLPGGGANVIRGGSSPDKVMLQNGHDDVHGGPDNDAVFYPNGNNDVHVTLDDKVGDGWVGHRDRDNIHSDVETVVTSFGNDTILGSDANNSFVGGTGNDHLFGGAGRDNLQGFGGRDVLGGGPGPDRLFGDQGADSLLARDGFADRLDCGPARDTVRRDGKDTVASDCEVVR